MSMPIPTPMPGDEPSLDHINQVIAEAEGFIADQADLDEPVNQVDKEQVDGEFEEPVDEFEDEFEDDDLDELDEYEVDGRTRSVRRLANEVAEAQRLVALQADDAIDQVDSASVRRLRTRIRDAARKHELAQNPKAAAYKAAKVRRVLTTVGFGAMITGLAWSTVGVHTTAAAGDKPLSAAWMLAWIIEPSITAVLLLIVGAKGYMASRGKPVSNKTVTRIEYGALAMTLTLNAWPHLPFIATHFSFVVLLVHLVGPLVATAAVMSLPVIWVWLAELPSEAAGSHGTPGTSSANTDGQSHPGAANLTRRPLRSVSALIEETRQAITGGELPKRPSVDAVRRHLKCAKQTASKVHRELFPAT